MRSTLERPQRADDIFDFILLKETNAGNARGSGGEAGSGILQRHAAQSEDGNLCWRRPRAGQEALGCISRASLFLFEDGRKDDKVGAFGFGADNVGGRVTGNSDKKVRESRVCESRAIASRQIDLAVDTGMSSERR